MKILVISNLYPPHIIGGYEIACQDFCDGLAGLGNQVGVLISRYRIDKDNYHTTVYGNYPNDVNDILGSLSDISSSVRKQPLVKPLAKRLLNFNDPSFEKNRLIRKWLGIKSVYFDLTNFIISLLEVWQFRPTIVYIWNLSFVSVAPILAAKLLGKKIVFHLEDYWLGAALRFNKNQRQGIIEETIKSILNRLLRRAVVEAPFIAVSEHIRRYYLNQGMISKKSVVVYNGLSPASPLAELDKLNQSSREPNMLLYVGRLIEDKGIHLIIEAIRILKEQGLTDCQLDIVGTGDNSYVERLRKMIGDYGLVGRVNFLGQKTHEETLELYSLHSIIVIPSIWDEPFGLVAIEAMASGCVPIVSSSGALPEIVENGKSGLIFKKGEAGDLAEKIKQLLANQSILEQLSANAVADVKDRFNLESKTKEVEKFLLSI